MSWTFIATTEHEVKADLTIVRHSHHQALLEAAVLALVATFLVDAAVQVTMIVD